MNNVIREKRRLNFAFKRIKNNDIRSLCGIIESEVLKLRDRQNDIFKIYSVDATDNSSFESKVNGVE